jgi:arylsulfatase A-like enzyme
LITYLEKNIGKDNFLIFLTADHGGVHNAVYLADSKIPSGYVNENMIIDSMKTKFKNTYGDSLIKSYSNQQFFLNHNFIEKNRLNLKEITTMSCAYLLKLEGIANAYSSSDMVAAASATDVTLSRVFMGFNDTRSGDIIVNYLPAYLDFMKTGTSHGAAYSYDTHVPLIWYGWNIKKGSSYEAVNINDIAPTVCSFLDIAFPNGCSGKPIINLLK